MSNIDPNIPKLVLLGDTLDTLTSISYQKIQTASQGTLTDFREGSPIAALVEGQVFALSELLYYANLLPEATALEVFRLYGATRSLGTKATGTLTFQLAAISNLDFVIPVGYGFTYKDTLLVLDTLLFIPAGTLSATANATAATVGAVYNADAYGVLVTSTGLNNLQSVYNETPFSGGTDIEPMEDTIARMQRTINTRQTIINQTDYELAAQDYLGVGSRAICVPRLNADKATLSFGNVGVFLLNSDGSPATAAQVQSIQTSLSDRSIIGINVWCFPTPIETIAVDLYIQVDSIDESISRAIFDTLAVYLSPNNYNGGYKVRYNELAYLARGVFGCKSVESVLINGNAIDYILPNNYTLPTFGTITVNQASADGYSLESIYSPSDVTLGDN